MLLQIQLNSYTKRLTSKILNLIPEFTVTYRAENVTGIRLLNGVVQVRVKVEEKSYTIPFNPQQFKAMVEEYRLEAIAAISTEESYERRNETVNTTEVASASTIEVVTSKGGAVNKRLTPAQRIKQRCSEMFGYKVKSKADLKHAILNRGGISFMQAAHLERTGNEFYQVASQCLDKIEADRRQLYSTAVF